MLDYYAPERIGRRSGSMFYERLQGVRWRQREWPGVKNTVPPSCLAGRARCGAIALQVSGNSSTAATVLPTRRGQSVAEALKIPINGTL